jgi:hypothetical protein
MNRNRLHRGAPLDYRKIAGPSRERLCRDLLELSIQLRPARLVRLRPESGEAFGRARQLCEQLNQPEQLRPVLYGLWVFRQVRGELELARSHAEEMRNLGRVRNDAIWKYFGSLASGAT